MHLNKEQIENLKKHLRDLRAPFKEILGEDEGYSTEIDEELAYLDQMRNSEVGENIAKAEAKFAEQADPVATMVGNMFGYEEGQLAPFYSKCIMIVAFIYGVLSVFSCFARPDFLNLTICTVAVHQLASVKSIRKSTFRNLVLGIFVSFLYDIVWLFFEWEEFEQDKGEIESEGKVEMGMKRFSLYVSVFSLLFRPVVMGLFWRVSIDFKAIMKPELL
uniref:Uncharacterized protein n=1 Tax=Strombidium inclinatum TaxID=197538 RepID=A0A7S3MX90_9SPIT|mmetsp:Transcript_23940/g.36660  ORF Transcript_23940/g.36660 Transcript_23940/m.36660 type:complete len:218 (+) Transcript_23940:1112-1765(+)